MAATIPFTTKLTAKTKNRLKAFAKQRGLLMEKVAEAAFVQYLNNQQDSK